MIDSLNEFKNDMWDFWKNDMFRGYPEDALNTYNSATDDDWRERYINHIEKRIEDLNYDLVIDLRWILPQERIEKTRDIKAYETLLKTLKGGE